VTSTQHNAWIRAGSPFRLARPLAKLRDRLRAYGYVVYDLGDASHLDAQPPEDHTAYSETGWPVKTPYGVGTAIDIMPPRAGSGLPSLQQLGAQILADRKANVPGASFLKYMNWEPERNNGGACFKESFRPNYVRTSSSDRGHIHLSQRSDMVDSAAADTYDPVARIRGGGATMAALDSTDKGWIDTLFRTYAVLTMSDKAAQGSGAETNQLAAFLRSWRAEQSAALVGLTSTANGLRTALEALAAVIKAGGGNIDTAAILSAISAGAAEDVNRDRELRDKIVALEAELETARIAEIAANRALANALDKPAPPT
jgi:hypothetical protein